jgi:hypothetical protein
LLLVLAYLRVFEPPSESGDWRKPRKRVENKRHTNTQQPFTSALPTEA